MHKQVQFKTLGMQRDLSDSAFNPKFAYENKNIRITATNDNTLYSITNEKGNKLMEVEGLEDSTLRGIPIGQAILDDKWIIFTTNNIEGNSPDTIYKLWFEGERLIGKIFYSGNLNLSISNPIETLVFYENEDIQKVYWTDGKNSPRVINIVADSNTIESWNDSSFDFTKTLKLQEVVTITKNIVASGNFAPGVVQYVFTYFDKYGAESNIFYTSPLLYVSYNNRGASPEDKVGCSFTIIVDQVDKLHDYLRVYSIHRTSIDATPTVKRVTDIATSGISSKVIITDNGTTGDIVDPTELLYVGGEDIICGTMSQKDNTLFLGDITLNRKLVDTTVRENLKNLEVRFNETKELESSYPSTGYYLYKSQLNKTSNDIKIFKYLETYRFGVQFQHKTGKWSEPIWVGDVQNNTPITSENSYFDKIKAAIATASLSNIEDIKTLINQGYVKVRPVIVFPTLSDRSCVCQGILCPTVYNIGDRHNNTPFVQSSWFTRPNAPYDIEKSSYTHWTNGDWIDRDTGENYSENSRSGVMLLEKETLTIASDNTKYFNPINKGSYLEFRHNTSLPENTQRNAEIQCITGKASIFNRIDGSSSNVGINPEYFCVDQSILTFHSPDIEFDTDIRSMDSSNLKLRIVGIVPVTAFISDIDIQTSTPTLPYPRNNSTGESPQGFYKESVGVTNISRYGFRGLVSGAFWRDSINGLKASFTGPSSQWKGATNFAIYPWHRNGSLNNTTIADEGGYKSAMLDKKKMSNLRYSYSSYYLNPMAIWEPVNGISGVEIFDSNESSLTKIPAPKNSGLEDLSYYGNIDKVITPHSSYPIVITAYNSTPTQDFSDDYLALSSEVTGQNTSSDPVRMKYKSTPHAVLALNYTNSGDQVILPTFKDKNSTGDAWILNDSNVDLDSDPNTTSFKFFWDHQNRTRRVIQSVIDYDFSYITKAGGIGPEYGWLYLAELYKDNITEETRFGGQTEEAIENNQWLPGGEAVSLIDNEGNPLDLVTIKWTEGDTYYQRYDHLKTYPFTLEDQNSVVDIMSFMCETRINIDGRYDRNRGQLSNLTMSPTNFNLLNNVYSQQNNFFNYRSINPNRLSLDYFPSIITWTKTKVAGDLVDTWTNITLASTLDLDGDKGKTQAIKRFNNNLLAFQDRGISQILYNENVQIASSEGVPIEIANSGKVSGKRYITDKIGCRNKWSMAETPYGIYFIDNNSKGIYLFNGQVTNMSTKLGFDSWIRNSTEMDLWNPKDFKGFVSYFDESNDEVLFINSKDCLAYSEVIGQFTSFYNYERTPYLANLSGKALTINKDYSTTDSNYKIWLHNNGDYNMYYGVFHPFYTTVVVNPDMHKDKIFNTVEFRADTWNKKGILIDDTFDMLTVWNEYQRGCTFLNRMSGISSSLKKKFRIWRANIPRDEVTNRDRIRNPWAYIKLEKREENTNKTILHDMIVTYFE